MNKRRFKMLIESVRKQPAKQFNMDKWAVRGKDEPACKTVGCAVGSFCIQHPRSQLKLVVSGRYQDDENKIVFMLRFKDRVDIDAAAAYFEILESESFRLFHPRNYEQDASKKTVLKRLTEFYNTKQRDVTQ